ncbi:MAG: inner membrane CreD family protein, partial [Candidatus Eremiobacteraeota bacterium]|nr:inner membrane CreD family protein [Candidatus Eremiobacteraeota bacterium]
MVRRLLAIALIFCGATVAWMILGATLLARTAESDSTQTERLAAQWGSEQTQNAPVFGAVIGKKTYGIPLLSSEVRVGLLLDQRRKGLLWYNLYDVSFVAHYVVRNDTAAGRIYLCLALPSSDGSYRDFALSIGGRRVPLALAVSGTNIDFALAPGETTTVDVAYTSRGMGTWQYRFGDNVTATNAFHLTMTTNFSAIDFPPKTLLPVSETPLAHGWRLSWKYSSLVTGNGIGMAFPYPLQPGPLAERITFWAPVALLFYLFGMLVVTTLRRIDLHPVNYFFLACAFFAFHLLFAYLVDRIPIEWAFAICSLVSTFLTISYLRLVAGWRFAAVESGIAQSIYLVLFSYALFNEGWAGLSIT